MKKKWIFSIIMFFVSDLWANDLINFNIYGRVRGEGYEDFGFTSEKGKYDYVGSKFRLTMQTGKEISNRWNILLQPQFVKYWAFEEFIPTSTTANSPRPTSNGVWDTRFDVHQALINYRPIDEFEIKIGRQIITYGDELIVGALEWNNVGRSSDALKFSYPHPKGSTDLFFSKIIEPTPFQEGKSDFYFTGIYSSNEFGKFFKTTDFYLLYKRDDFAADDLNQTTALGVRIKASQDRFDHRIEVTGESVKNSFGEFNSEYQFDFEVGYKINQVSTRFSLELFQSSKFYDQFFPGVHKFLGYADQFGRRNIKGSVLGIQSKFSESLNARLDFHSFYRSETDQPIYNLTGKIPYLDLNKSGSRDVANELDFGLFWDLEKGLGLELGLSYVVPQSYMKSLQLENGEYRNNEVKFAYLALEAKY